MIGSDDEARAYCAQFIDEDGFERLEHYLARLVEENKRQNLVSAGSLKAAWQRHIADSVQLLTHVPRGTGCWADLGTGAGPPGLIVAIARPTLKMRLIESRKKRIEFLRSVIDELALDQCTVVGAKVEDIESFAADVMSARGKPDAPLDRRNDESCPRSKGNSAAP